MKRVIGWLNPSLHSKNLGDIIIADAVHAELSKIFGQDVKIVELPTQRFWNRRERQIAKDCHHFIVGGTNLLNGNIPRYLQWKVDPFMLRTIAGRTSLMGVGWWQYQGTNEVSAWLWRTILVGGLHSVRDEYTKQKLAKIGVDSINTACPTMWGLTERIDFPRPSNTVVSTITDYHADEARDRRMIEILKSTYSNVVVWPQGSGDRQYLAKIAPDLELLAPNLQAFNSAIARPSTDYFGTRLHAGIRALQRSVRSMIVPVDNRAVEINRDTGLPIATQKLSADELLAFAESRGTEIRLPRDQIDQWRHGVLDVIER